MTKPDWADEAAEGLLDQITGHPDFTRANINFLATALRKAKAEGMREAAKMSEYPMGLIARADEIEGGQ